MMRDNGQNKQTGKIRAWDREYEDGKCDKILIGWVPRHRYTGLLCYCCDLCENMIIISFSFFFFYWT